VSPYVFLPACSFCRKPLTSADEYSVTSITVLGGSVNSSCSKSSNVHSSALAARSKTRKLTATLQQSIFAQMRLTDNQSPGQFTLADTAACSEQLDISADYFQTAFIVHIASLTS